MQTAVTLLAVLTLMWGMFRLIPGDPTTIFLGSGELPPDALAALKGKVCQGCRGSVTDQKAFELQAGGFVVCPNAGCGRLLYPAE